MKRLLAIALSCLLVWSVALSTGVASDLPTETALSPHQAVAEMKIGSNLAGVYDGIDWSYRTGYDSSRSGRKKVDYWTTPNTSQLYAYTDILQDAGYNAIRLTITWTPHMDNQTFLIDAEWLDEIERAVNYITGKGMYCIIDSHYDYLGRSWVGTRWAYDWMFDEYKEYVDARFTALWTQVAERFKDHDQKLIFEAFNEPGMAGTVESEYGDFDAYMDFSASRLNELNALFVQTVRNTGTQNTNRFLLIGGYLNNNPKRSCIDRFVVPDDAYLIMSFHVYSVEAVDGLDSEYPDYLPASSGSRANALIRETRKNAGGAKYALSPNEIIDEMFNRIDEFMRRTGVPAVVGEWGNTEAFSDEARIQQAEYFIRRAKRSGTPCFWWECFNESWNSDEKFALYDRVMKHGWKHKDLLDAIDLLRNQE